MAPQKKKAKSQLAPTAASIEACKEAYAAFQQGQYFEQATDDLQATASCYAHVIDLAKSVKPNTYQLPKTLEQAPTMPPFEVILSGAHNSLAGLYLDARSFDEAREHFELALKVWPENSMALVNFANLEHENGCSDDAWQLMQRVLEIQNPLLNDEVDPDSEYEWLNEWVIGPHLRCVETATYMTALHLHQQGEYEKGKELLQRFGFQHRLAPVVWDAVKETARGTSKEVVPIDNECPVKLFRNAIPTDILTQLQNVFSPSSPFWEETDYKERAYFSFWYDVKQPPNNVVEKLIQDMLPLTGCDDIVGAEWWVHSRPLHRNLGHQLHFDTEENTLRATGKIVHPVWSSVCYLSGAGASPTLVLDQDSSSTKMAQQGWLAKPVQGGFLLFPGDRLHGVLPLSTTPEEAKAADPSRRLTLMIGFWNKNVVKEGKRYALGPCGPVPPSTRSCSWPSTLSQFPHRPSPSATSRPGMEQLGVTKLDGVWEEIDESDSAELEVPLGIDTGFFAMDSASFVRQLVESCQQ